MQIKLDDVQFTAELAVNAMLNVHLNKDADVLKKNNQFSEQNVIRLFNKYSYNTAMHTDFATDILVFAIAQAISEYHDQLREKLLESGIDIGELDTTSRTNIKKLKIRMMQTAKHNFDFVDLFARFFHFKGRLIPQFRKREHHKRNLFLMVQHLLIQGFRIFCLLRCIRSRLFPARDPLDNFHGLILLGQSFIIFSGN